MSSEKEKMCGILMHLSTNMWVDVYDSKYIYSDNYKSKTMKFDKKTWDESIKYAAECGFNTILIDLGDAIKYKSHPEIALPDAWEISELKEELDKIKALGMVPIPKLNFSTSHDAWLGDYGRMISTDTYYEVCKDLIEEVIDIFEKPKYFHLGLDEERSNEQEDNGSE